MKSKKLLTLGCIAATMLLSNATWAQVTADVEKSAAQDIPTAEQVIADYLKASGGEDKFREIKTIVSKGTVAIPEVGIEGDVTISQNASRQMLMEMSMPQIGSQSTGYNGKVGWSMSDMQGPEVLDGDRLQQIKLQSLINQYLDVNENFSKVECTGVEEFNGEDCYVVSTSNDDGSAPIVSYFSKKSKMLIGNKMEVATPQGNLEVISEISDYKDVGGMLMSHKAVAKFQGMSQVVTMTEISVNADLPESKFDLPEDIQELVDDE